MKRRYILKTIALVMVVSLGAVFTVYSQSSDIHRLTNKQFKKKAKKENVIILDVRTPEEFKEGHIQNAVLMDYKQTDNFMKHVQTLDSTKTYLLYCRSGKRSYNAAIILKEKGFKQVFDLKEGISMWNGPLIKEDQ